MGHPGKRAPTVQLCDDPKGFVPLAQRQHALGPYPLDPNLIAQGIPPDDRVDANAHLYGPVEGTPLLSGTPPAPEATPPGPEGQAPESAAPTAPPEPPSDTSPPPEAVPAAPSSFAGNGTGASPSVAVARYNPRTGAYMASDGHLYHQSNLVAAAPKAWTDLVLGEQ
jgi:hypothetical protein